MNCYRGDEGVQKTNVVADGNPYMAVALARVQDSEHGSASDSEPEELYARDDGQEVSPKEKRYELKMQLGKIFGKEHVSNPNYTKCKKWSVEYNYRKADNMERCWCTTPIQHIYYLTHADIPKKNAVIGSTCMKQFFDTNPSLKESAAEQMRAFSARKQGRACKHCNKPLTKFRRKIQYEKGFCDKDCQFQHNSRECSVSTCGERFVPRQSWMDVCLGCYYDKDCVKCGESSAQKRTCKQGKNQGRVYSRCTECYCYTWH